ncbi:hypothetical protein IQ265_18935 [Nodosilinea sp. LEGE 06152]|uniref:hypothetical protein n=1 Tax=Nodosilinea sp. LEGE 06152 TaxID=2777966 RepID=UPI00187E8824|nr:hypothetical protein [Nodosilinea sp. LEGE 06152]MBE9158894.1 hypothetical protein [Nodosilinea sp. LEGE 06152]
MGAIAFLVLFVLGFLLATVGGIIGLVDAFRVSPVWGLLSLFVPFVLLVYCIKFWGRKWARNSLIMSLGGLGVMLLSTPLMGAFIAQRAGQLGISTEEEVPAEGTVIEPVPVPDEQVATGEEFAEPLVPVAPQLAPIARADLIQSTDPNERLQQINNSRIDPFAAVPVPPPPQVVAPPAPPGSPLPGAGSPVGTTTAGGGAAGGGAAGGGGGGGGGAAGSPVAAAPGTPGGAGTGTGTTPGAAGGARPGTPSLAPLPALPQPTLAEAVLVTGVMTIGNENFAVVETSAGSQYVRAGQRVANGQVLVKRIDVRGSDPVVVLEQNGIEVSRPVGAAPATAADEQPAA